MKKTEAAPYERIIFVCCNEREQGQDACANRGSVALQEKLKKCVRDRGVSKIRISKAMCFGLCSIGPNVAVFPDNVWYNGVTLDDIETLVQKYVEPCAAKT